MVTDKKVLGIVRAAKPFRSDSVGMKRKRNPEKPDGSLTAGTPDRKGEEGDVRDILIIRSGIKWEIGLSIKHNHFAVKHSRLSPTIDFGKKWYNKSCSSEYWKTVLPIFDFLEQCRGKGIAWHDMADKDEKVYITLLKAFKKDTFSRG